jgi:hypothetical protein
MTGSLKKEIIELLRNDMAFRLEIASLLLEDISSAITLTTERESTDDFGNTDGAISEVSVDYTSEYPESRKKILLKSSYISFSQHCFNNYWLEIPVKHRIKKEESRILYHEIMDLVTVHSEAVYAIDMIEVQSKKIISMIKNCVGKVNSKFNSECFNSENPYCYSKLVSYNDSLKDELL